MEYFKSIDEVLDFAMKSEQEAINFYNRMATTMENQEMRETFLEFAREEVNHKARLQKIKDERLFDFSDEEKIQNLQISDYVVNVKSSPDMMYADALLLAMKKEKAAFKLYITLSQRTSSKELKAVFESLAQEESKHKLRFELEYDEHVLREN